MDTDTDRMGCSLRFADPVCRADTVDGVLGKDLGRSRRGAAHLVHVTEIVWLWLERSKRGMGALVTPEKSAHWYTRSGEPMYTVTAKDGSQRKTDLRDARKLGLVPSVT